MHKLKGVPESVASFEAITVRSTLNLKALKGSQVGLSRGDGIKSYTTHRLTLFLVPTNSERVLILFYRENMTKRDRDRAEGRSMNRRHATY